MLQSERKDQFGDTPTQIYARALCVSEVQLWRWGLQWVGLHKDIRDEGEKSLSDRKKHRNGHGGKENKFCKFFSNFTGDLLGH